MHIPEDEAERRRLKMSVAVKSSGGRTALCVRIVRMAM